MIPGGNGTAPSPVQSFTTAQDAGSKDEFSLAILCDMGYTNAQGTRNSLVDAVEQGISFVWHGGDITYADDFFEAMTVSCKRGASA